MATKQSLLLLLALLAAAAAVASAVTDVEYCSECPSRSPPQNPLSSAVLRGRRLREDWMIWGS